MFSLDLRFSFVWLVGIQGVFTLKVNECDIAVLFRFISRSLRLVTCKTKFDILLHIFMHGFTSVQQIHFLPPRRVP